MKHVVLITVVGSCRISADSFVVRLVAKLVELAVDYLNQVVEVASVNLGSTCLPSTKGFPSFEVEGEGSSLVDPDIVIFVGPMGGIWEAMAGAG